MADIVQYQNLITSEHQDKPNFMATVAAVIAGFVDQQNVAHQFPFDYDLDVAVGSQLDVCGQWIGLSRVLRAPVLDVYFTLDSDTLGFDLGIWKGPGDATYGLVTLDDNTYRSLLKSRALSNRWDGSLEMAQQILALWFSTFPDTLAFVQDNHDMSITIGIAGTVPSPLFQFLTAQGYIFIRPGGVKLRETVMAPPGGPLFGMDVDNAYIGGFDTGRWAEVIPTV